MFGFWFFFVVPVVALLFCLLVLFSHISVEENSMSIAFRFVCVVVSRLCVSLDSRFVSLALFVSIALSLSSYLLLCCFVSFLVSPAVSLTPFYATTTFFFSSSPFFQFLSFFLSFSSLSFTCLCLVCFHFLSLPQRRGCQRRNEYVLETHTHCTHVTQTRARTPMLSQKK